MPIVAVCSCCPISGGPPQNTGGGLLHCRFRGLLSVHFTLRPACSPSRLSDPLHRRLRRLRFLHRRSDCFRVERTPVPGRDFHLQSTSAFSRRTCRAVFKQRDNRRNCTWTLLSLVTPCDGHRAWRRPRRKGGASDGRQRTRPWVDGVSRNASGVEVCHMGELAAWVYRHGDWD